MKSLAALVCSMSLLAASLGHAEPRYAHTGPTVIRRVRVIDGLGNEPVENQDLLLRDGKIAAIGKAGSVDAPAGALEIDGQGLTAMPGLIDMHIHLQGGWANGFAPGEKFAIKYDDASLQQRLNGYVYAGVTTVLDIGNDHAWVLGMRGRIEKGEFLAPRFFVAGAPWSQAPSGWDAAGDAEDRGDILMDSMKVESFEAIPGQLDRYQKDGIEIIKLYSGISPLAAHFLIAAAHERGIQTVADFWDLNLDTVMMRATGLDGWAHTGGFEIAAPEDHKWMAENDRFVIGTANVGEKLAGLRVDDEGGKRLMAQEPLIVDIWGEEAANDFYDVYPQIREAHYEGPEAFYQQMGFGDMKRFRKNFLVNIKGSHDAGVLVAGGTDDIYPSLWPGEAMHRELELLVMAGISPIDAIQICSHNGARILRRDKEFGSLREGMSADLLLVEGNPANDVSDSRNVRHVFLRGRQVDRDSLKLKN